MRILVTGITGFVGGHLAEHLLDLGDEVIGLSSSGRWPAELDGLLGDRARLERWDIAAPDDGGLAGKLGRIAPDAVIHLAAQSNPSASTSDPKGTWEINFGGTHRLLEGLRTAGLRPRVILVGSGVSYGNPAPEHLPVHEQCPLRPVDPYGASKAAADILGVQHALGFGADVVVVRPFNHAGPRQSPRYVLSGMARQVAAVEAGRAESVAMGNRDVVRDFTDVRDVVRAYRLLCGAGTAGEIYNLGSGAGTRLGDALVTLRSLAKIPVAMHVEPSLVRPVDVPRLIADPAKLRKATGWAPLIPIEQTLADLLEYWRGRDD